MFRIGIFKLTHVWLHILRLTIIMILQTIKVHIEKNNKYWLDINEIKLYQIYHFQLFLLHQGNILLPQYLQNLLLNKKKC